MSRYRTLQSSIEDYITKRVNGLVTCVITTSGVISCTIQNDSKFNFYFCENYYRLVAITGVRSDSIAMYILREYHESILKFYFTGV